VILLVVALFVGDIIGDDNEAPLLFAELVGITIVPPPTNRSIAEAQW
jgi:hypothetical protein